MVNSALESLGHLPQEGMLSPGIHSHGLRTTVSSSVDGEHQAQRCGTPPDISGYTGSRHLLAQIDDFLKVDLND